MHDLMREHVAVDTKMFLADFAHIPSALTNALKITVRIPLALSPVGRRRFGKRRQTCETRAG